MISDFASVCCVLFPLSFARFALQKIKLEVSLPYTLEYFIIENNKWRWVEDYFPFHLHDFYVPPLVFRGARWTPPSYYKWKYNPYKWPYNMGKNPYKWSIFHPTYHWYLGPLCNTGAVSCSNNMPKAPPDLGRQIPNDRHECGWNHYELHQPMWGNCAIYILMV